MESTFFFFRDKKRFWFFVKCVAIGLPLLIIAALAVNYYEDSRDAAGVANNKGGLDYYYRSGSGAKALPEPVAKLLPLYPNGAVTYINVSTDKSQKPGGDMILFTNDGTAQIADFYKSSTTVVELTDDDLVLKANGQDITFDKETIQEDDPKDKKNKFRISFGE